jgi:hypothetical protein
MLPALHPPSLFSSHVICWRRIATSPCPVVQQVPGVTCPSSVQFTPTKYFPLVPSAADSSQFVVYVTGRFLLHRGYVSRIVVVVTRFCVC